MMKIGVLDIQGSVDEHLRKLLEIKKCQGLMLDKNSSENSDFEVVRVKKAEDLNGVSGLIIPGGESTTVGMLLRRFGLRDAVLARAKEGMAIWGTCAGAILLAKNIVGEQKADTLGLMNIDISRNSYGRQLDSFEDEILFDGKKIPAIFIRAPKITAVGDDVEVLAKYGEEIVACKDGKLMATSFHPELTDDLTVHHIFLKSCY